MKTPFLKSDRLGQVATIVALLFLTSTAQTFATSILLNFEDIPGMPNAAGSPIPVASRLSNQYQSTAGVTFSSGSSYVGVLFMNPGDAPSGSNVVGGSTLSGNLTYDGAFPITATFSVPGSPSIPAVTDFVSLRVDQFVADVRTLTLNAYDINGTLIATYSVPDQGGPTLQVSAPGIHSVQFIGTVDADGAAMDDFMFNSVVAVPEPSTISLTIIGALFLRGIRRKAFSKR